METTTKVRFTTQDFHLMGEVGLLDADRTYELIDGEIYRMAPESYNHASTVTRIADLFRKRIGQMGLNWSDYVREGHPIEASDHDEPEPDVALLRGEPGRTPRPEDVRLVIEVSRTTYEKDRGMKQRMYAQAGIPEYWIVRIEPDGPRVLEVYRRPEGNAYLDQTTYNYDEEIEVETWPELGPFLVDDLLG